MNFINFTKVFAVTSISATLGACGGSADAIGDNDGNEVSVEEAIKANAKPGSFKLYGRPNVTPNRDCDLFTQLDLKADYYSTATLSSGVAGVACEIAAADDKRTYRLKLAETDCGTKIYTGSRTVKGERNEIKITDNRARVCEDVIAAVLIVDETTSSGTVTRYSHVDRPVTVWPADVRTLLAESHGSFRRVPSGSECLPDQAKYSLDIASKKVTWEVCELVNRSTIFTKKSGATTLSKTMLKKITSAAKNVEVSGQTFCGNDKPAMDITVTSSSWGEQKFFDAFYACQGEGTYVNGIDEVLDAFREVVGK